MTPDQIAALVTSIPNLAIAVWCIYNYQQTIKLLLINQQLLVDKLMALHPPADPIEPTAPPSAPGSPHK